MILHNNATTNKTQRREIQESTLKITELADKYEVSEKTVSKWKNRRHLDDVTSKPHRVNYALTDGEQSLVIAVRKMTWVTGDDIVDMLEKLVPQINRTNCYRTLKRHGVSRIPKEERKKKKFKTYEPGYLHIDITYLPRLEGSKRKYLYVSIDRATRLVYIALKDDKSKESTTEFLEECVEFYPFKIAKVLTDNGLEFSTRLYKRKMNIRKAKKGKFTRKCDKLGIEHRTTQIKSPWTNGMVERFNKTIKYDTVKKYRYRDFEHLEKELHYYVRVYNLFKKHSSLNRKTPYQMTLEWYRKKPEIFKCHPSRLVPKYYRNNLVKHYS